MPQIINVQRYSIHDGEGIRTTVFFKGCPLRCAWCHNPESQQFHRQVLYDRERCLNCGSCLSHCNKQALMLQEGSLKIDTELCGKGDCSFGCEAACIYGARQISGEEMTVKDLLRQLLRDRNFYEESEGGVTLSGGEVMVQDLSFLLDLLKALKKEGISVNIDTCGDCDYERFEQILPYVDTFLYDMKAFSEDLHKQYTGRSNQRILKNLKELSQSGAKINLRIPLIPEVNGNAEEMERMIAFAKENLRLSKINLLPYHRAGSDKWERLGWQTELFSPPSSEEMEQWKQLWDKAGLAPVRIGG